MFEQNIFNFIFVFPILNILVILYKGFLFLKIPGAFGFAVISLTLFIRLILHPFFKKQIETTKKLQEIKPHLDSLSKKHKNDPKKLQEEQLKIYQQYKINPASGCLFMIIQIPIFIALYKTLSLFLLNGKSEKLINSINNVLYHSILKINYINPWFFGFNLGLSPQKSGNIFYLIIPLLTFFLQYYQTQLMTPEKKEEDKKEKEKDDDFQKALSIQMKFFLPLMIGYFSYSLPVGLSLYWNIFSLFSIFQLKSIKNIKS